MKTKIEWCDITWNPVWGCLNNCPYCYARKIAKRFYRQRAHVAFPEDGSGYWYKTANNIINFIPTWIEQNFNKKFPKKPSNIFVNSMSDITFWEHEWILKVLNKIKENPQYQFLFLTKNIWEYESYNFSKNCWLGVTITNQMQMNHVANVLFNTSFDDKNNFFVSLEPIHEAIKLYIDFDWVIIGAETGNRKDKIIPKKEWIEDIRKYCKDENIPYFEKSSLQKIVNRELIQEFPKGLKHD